MSHRPRSGDQFPGTPNDPSCCVAILSSSSVPLCPRESQCFFSQRHGATEFLIVVSAAHVPAEISFRGQEVLTSSRSCLRGGRSNWCVPSCSLFSVPLCPRESQCFFSQRHGATEFLIVVSAAHVPAEISFRGQKFELSPQVAHAAEDQTGVSPVAPSCSFSVPLCLRESQCFFSQRHGATEFQIAASPARVSAEIHCRGQKL
jgi:hypothetical protein